MKLLRSFPISPIFGFQRNAGPARGKGDRRAMAVIHTASRRAAGPKLCSYFVLTPNASGNANRKAGSTSIDPGRGKMAQCCFWGTPFSAKSDSY